MSVLRTDRLLLLPVVMALLTLAGCGGDPSSVEVEHRPAADSSEADLTGVLIDVHHEPG